MMAQSTPFIVLVAALFINTLSYCSAENVYCVTPTATSCSSCPHNSTHCATLSGYAQEAELYFTSNTTVMFLPGNHNLDTNITVANVTRFTMRGKNFSGNISTIVCNGSIGFRFTDMVNFSIYSLAFTSYNRSWSYGSHLASNSAFLLQSTVHAKLVNCSFHHNHGTALTVCNTNITLAESEFTHNQCACQSFSEICGCGITALNSNLQFTGNVSFHENTASFRYGAGAIWASASSLSFTETNTFTGNSAQYGGAIHAEANTSLHFNGTSNFCHNSAYSGGVFYVSGSVILTFNGTSNFFNNSASNNGGVIFTIDNIVLNFNGTNNFLNNSASNNGGAIFTMHNTVLNFNGTNNFFNNSASNNGGAIFTLHNTVINFNGTNNFSNNSVNINGNGGAIYTAHNVVLTFSGTNNFFKNSAGYFSNGGAIFVLSSTLSFTGTSTFNYNSAGNTRRYGGGAIYITYSTVNFNGTNKFMGNFAKNGATFLTRINVKLTLKGTNNFFNNSAFSGGVVYASTNTLLSFIGTSNFTHNSAHYHGGAIYALHKVVLNFIGTNNFIGNCATRFDGGAIYTYNKVVLTFNGTSNFTNNSADANGGTISGRFSTSLSASGTSSFSGNSAMQGGAISAEHDSTLIFNGNISFIDNGHDTRDSRGGAVYLAFNSNFSIFPNTTVCLKNNHAQLGGAIYVFNVYPFIYCTQITTYIPKEKCFFHLPDLNLVSGIGGVRLVFKNNSADAAGSVLYGGAIDKCKITGSVYSGKVFNMLAQYEDDNTTSSISSDPFHICPCKNNHPNCMDKPNNALSLSVYPGETFQVSVVSTGQRNGIVPSVVRSRMDRGRLLSFQYIQQTSKSCTILSYTVFSQQNVTLELYADGPCSTFGDKLVLRLSINQTCPPGFSISQEENLCVCDQMLSRYTNHCNITNGLGRITRESDDTFWVGYHHYHGLTVHPYCPFDYCVNNTVVFPLNNTDIQCAQNRSGLLCGACKNKGYSLVLGSSHCKQCKNVYLLLLIPFTLIGVALVFLLLVCKLTVATGTLSGLVFYANIVGANHKIFLPVKSAGALSIFIAWLNLDFGIETCFFDGMDSYTKTWLQFLFPVYIWLLVGLVILIGHYSQRFTNLLGSNPVSVLATLILLSYTKILRTFIMAVSFTDFHYQYHYNKRAWLYDANVEYLVSKHIPLFLVAMLVFFFLFLPYTLLLLFGRGCRPYHT